MDESALARILADLDAELALQEAAGTADIFLELMGNAAPPPDSKGS